MKFYKFLALVAAVTSFTVPLERRKSFIQTHQEHGHLPGGDNNPGYGALISQVFSILQGKSPSEVLDDYNEKADNENGVIGTGEASKGGLLSSLGLSDLPVVGGLV